MTETKWPSGVWALAPGVTVEKRIQKLNIYAHSQSLPPARHTYLSVVNTSPHSTLGTGTQSCLVARAGWDHVPRGSGRGRVCVVKPHPPTPKPYGFTPSLRPRER